MGNKKRGISEQIQSNADTYAKEIIDLQYKIQPELIKKYDKLKNEKILHYITSTLNFLSASISVNNEELYFDYIKWFTSVIKKNKIPYNVALTNLQCMKEILYKEILIDEKHIIAKYIDESIKYMEEMYSNEIIAINSKPNYDKIDELLTYLLNYEKESAVDFIFKKLDEGANIKEIYIDYIQETLYKIGEMWQVGEITVAKEHYCTAVIQHIISLLYPYLFTNKNKKNRTMIAVSAGQELHEIGIRMVTDFFELDGWDTFYLGANIPVDSIMDELTEKKVDLLGISITMGSNVKYAMDIINLIKSNKACCSTKIIVGGRAFNESKDLWKKIGADGYGYNAIESVNVGNSLIGNIV